MKLSTVIIVSKGLAYMTIGIFTPWSVALAQWINTNSWPEKIVWIGVILPASAIGGASQWLAFCSGSFKTYTEQRNLDTVNSQQNKTP